MLYRKGDALYDDNDNEVYSMADVRREEKEKENDKLKSFALDELQERYENMNIGYQNQYGEMEDWANEESLFYFSERTLENGITNFISLNNKHIKFENMDDFIKQIRTEHSHYFQKDILENIHQNGLEFFEHNAEKLFDKLVHIIFEKELLSSPSNQKHFERRIDDYEEFDTYNSIEKLMESFYEMNDFVIEKNEDYKKLLNKFVETIKTQKVDYLFGWEQEDKNGKLFYNRFPLKNVSVSEMENCVFSKKIFYVEGDVIYKKEVNLSSPLGAPFNAQVSWVIDGKRTYIDNLGEKHIVSKQELDEYEYGIKGFHIINVSCGDKVLDAFYQLDKKVNERPFFKPDPNNYSSRINIEEQIDEKIKKMPALNSNLIQRS